MAAITAPTVDELSALMRARTEGELSYQGVFNEETRPTAVQAADLIDVALTIVSAKLGLDIPESLVSAAGKAVLFKAASLVEVTYYPEQANEENSSYELWQGQYEELRDALVEALKNDRPNESRISSVKTYGRNGYDPDNPPA